MRLCNSQKEACTVVVVLLLLLLLLLLVIYELTFNSSSPNSVLQHSNFLPIIRFGDSARYLPGDTNVHRSSEKDFNSLFFVKLARYFYTDVFNDKQ